MSEQSGRLGWGEKIGYSLGDAGSNFWKVYELDEKKMAEIGKDLAHRRGETGDAATT